jgi:hypothetical protein
MRKLKRDPQPSRTRDSRDLDWCIARLESGELDDDERRILRECKRDIERRIPQGGRR